jgi:hypothetical protein
MAMICSGIWTLRLVPSSGGATARMPYLEYSYDLLQRDVQQQFTPTATQRVTLIVGA